MFQRPCKRETPHEAEEDLNRGTQAQHDTFQKKKGGTRSSWENLGNADLKGNVSERVIAAFSFARRCAGSLARGHSNEREELGAVVSHSRVLWKVLMIMMSLTAEALWEDPGPVFFFPPTSDWQAKCCSSDGGYEEKCKMISSAVGGARTELAFSHLTSEKPCKARVQDGGCLLLLRPTIHQTGYCMIFFILKSSSSVYFWSLATFGCLVQTLIGWRCFHGL